MAHTVNTVSVDGLSPFLTEVQASIFPGLPSFTIVGLASRSVTESSVRIRAALNSIGIDLPPKKVVVNLSPTDITKEGNYLDLPIALALLCEIGIIKNYNPGDYIVVGELSLSGEIKSVNVGMLVGMFAETKKKALICPYENSSITSLSGNSKICAAADLWMLINFLNNREALPSPNVAQLIFEENFDYDIKSVSGNAVAKRALEIAAAGGHSTMLMGPPGRGKTLLANCLPSIMPPLNAREIVEVCLVNSLTNQFTKEVGSFFKSDTSVEKIIIKRPFRSPHHSASSAAMVGGGKRVEPGEVTLAHCGILFLDELGEFPTVLTDSLRQCMESQTINIARADRHVTYPADFQLIATMNPCKCGFYGDVKRQCNRAPTCAHHYQRKISGPFLDRIDLFINMGIKESSSLAQQTSLPEESSVVRARVTAARLIQEKRFNSYINNARVKGNLIELFKVNAKALTTINTWRDMGEFNMRSYSKVLRVSRTIADLDASEEILDHHILEAIFFRKNCLSLNNS